MTTFSWANATRVVLIATGFVALAACTPTKPTSLGELFGPQDATLTRMPAPPSLAPSQVPTWNALSPRQQRDALAVINNGGSFADYLAV